MNPNLVSVAMEFFLKGKPQPMSAVVIIADTKAPMDAKLVEQYIKGRLAVPHFRMSELSTSALQTYGNKIAADVSRRFHVECHAIAPRATCRIIYGEDHPFMGMGEGRGTNAV